MITIEELSEELAVAEHAYNIADDAREKAWKAYLDAYDAFTYRNSNKEKQND